MIGNRLAFTNKCVFVVVLTDGSVNAVCFPCVKNAGGLWQFAADHSVRLQSIVQQLGGQCIQFRAPSTSGVWFFNLRGFFCVSGSDEMYQCNVWPVRLTVQSV